VGSIYGVGLRGLSNLVEGGGLSTGINGMLAPDWLWAGMSIVMVPSSLSNRLILSDSWSDWVEKCIHIGRGVVYSEVFE
jgi:hypothetical protein